VKKDESFREKIDLRNERRAAELQISLAELHERGLNYSEKDITDAIGLRYVVSPWELPVLLQRLKRVLGPKLLAVDYKRGRYKSVHLDVDLWGVGARRDLNLMAEVQVRTRIQDFYANAVHDVIYKDVPGGGFWFLRVLKRSPATRWTLPFWDRLLALPSDVELLLFQKWMRWRNPRSEDL
jgi:ppGpp synthetase/RelA/SpoT-type nucleotidyltranferase